MKKFKRAVEVGAGDFYSSKFVPLMSGFDSLDLIEPNPFLFQNLFENVASNSNIRLHNFAVSDFSGIDDLFLGGYTSSLKSSFDIFRNFENSNIWSALNLLSKKTLVVDFGIFDQGNIDYLSLNCSGAELKVLSKMVSRPEAIIMKFYLYNFRNNFYYREIEQWMRLNYYNGSEISRNKHGTVSEMGFWKVSKKQ